MEKKEIIALLTADMRGEHQAIIQYLRHAYMTAGVKESSIEAVARDEMRHLDWLADAITELGGDPTMERDQVDMASGSAAGQMLKDVGLEQVAINQYRDHIARISDKKIQRLLSRILQDEIDHKAIFEELAQKAVDAEPQEAEQEVDAPDERTSAILNEGVRHEYTVILQYLYHSFHAEGKELSEELMNAAINEMQHMGWLSENLAERNGDPDMRHTELVLTDDPKKGLLADIAVEREVTQAYTSQIPELNDVELKELLTRIRDHEIYHEAVFNYLLDEIEEGDEATAEPKLDETPEPVPEKDAPKTIPTVGSLIDTD